jgi:hypothetical protein
MSLQWSMTGPGRILGIIYHLIDEVQKLAWYRISSENFTVCYPDFGTCQTVWSRGCVSYDS